MAQWKLRSKRKSTGGLLRRLGKKKRHQRGRDFLPAHVGSAKSRKLRTRGKNQKIMVLSANTASIAAGGKTRTAKILSVAENPADSQFVRRNIITKGAILLTELGRARVTSSPGQSGVVNAVLVEEKAAQKKA